MADCQAKVQIYNTAIPRKLLIDKLGSYGAARRDLLPGVTHCPGARQNNRAAISPQPTRHQERQRRRFKSMRQAQRFLLVHGPVNKLFRVERHLVKAAHYRLLRARAVATGRSVTCVRHAADE